MLCVWRRYTDRTTKLNWVCKILFQQSRCWTPRSGKFVEADEDKIDALIAANSRITTLEIAERLHLWNLIVHDHVKRLGYGSKLDICSTSSYDHWRTKFTSSYNDCNFVFQTTRKCFIFDANRYWRREIGCL